MDFRLILIAALPAAIVTAPDPVEASAAGAAAPRRPNIVLILADDLGFSDIGSFGGEIPTPHIDALAERGVKFSEFYNTARCWPSRAALMSGLYPHQVGLGGELQYRRPDGAVVPPPNRSGPYQGFFSSGTPNLAERLKSIGYKTYMTGKWHLGDVDVGSWPTRRGFDQYFGPVTGTDSYFSTGVDPARARKYVMNETEWPVPTTGFYATTAFTDKAAEFIKRSTSEDPSSPFFLYVAYTAPHWPLHALPADIARQNGAYDKGWDAIRTERWRRARALGLISDRHVLPPRPANVPPWSAITEKDRWADRMEVYAAQIDAMDQGIGRIVKALRDNRRFDDTIILFLSDNGGTEEDLADRPSTARFNDPFSPPGSRTRFEAYTRRWAFVSNTPYQGYKVAMGEGGVRTPFVVHWPAGIRSPGRTSRQVGHIIDLAPTLLSLAGERKPPVAAEGENLAADIMRPRRARERTLYFEHLGNRAVRQGSWKLVMNAGQPWRLYHLASDPTELRNLVAARPEMRAMLIASWERWAARVGVQGFAGRDPKGPHGRSPARVGGRGG